VLCFVVIEYFLVGWDSDAGTFFFFWFSFYLYTSICSYVGQWMAVLMPNAKVANVAVGAISCLFNLFGGYLLPFPQMYGFYRWFTYVLPSRYSLSALVGSQFGDRTASYVTLTSGKNVTVATYIETEYDFRPDDRYYFMLALILFWVVIQTFIYLTLKYVSHLKR